MTDVSESVSPEKLPEPEYHRKYGSRTSALQVLENVDLSGKTFLITGSTSGIGIETARALALKGAHVVMANRSIVRSETIRDEIYKETEHRKIDLIHLDLSSLQSVQAAANEFLSKGWPLHVLILNAGVFGPEQKTTIDGHSLTFATNHLAHFYLTQLLKEKLIESAPSRVVVVSSSSHRHTMIKPASTIEAKLEALIPPPDCSSPAYLQYARSKLCNVLFAFKLHRELNQKGVNIYVLHPGSMIGTNIGRSYGAFGRFFNKLTKPFTKTLEQGAATTVYCAASPDVEKESGRYYESCWEEEKNLHKALTDDIELQDALWEQSSQLIQRYEQSRP